MEWWWIGWCLRHLVLGVWTVGKVPQALGDTICDLANGGNSRGYCEQPKKSMWFSLALGLLLFGARHGPKD